jgi:hypothetical protein
MPDEPSIPICPQCRHELTSYKERCAVCGWQGTPVEVKQQGTILRELGDKFEIALNDGSVGIYHKHEVYPSPERQPNGLSIFN